MIRKELTALGHVLETVKIAAANNVTLDTAAHGYVAINGKYSPLMEDEVNAVARQSGTSVKYVSELFGCKGSMVKYGVEGKMIKGKKVINSREMNEWLFDRAQRQGHVLNAIKGRAPEGVVDEDGNQEDMVNVAWQDTQTGEVFEMVYGYED